MNKKQGIDFLKEYGLNTVKLLSLDDLYNDPNLIKEGLSLRLSSYNDNIDVNLPSIHNVTDINYVLDFFKKYQNNFNILIHKTIFPKVIGSISKYSINDYMFIVIETFKDFFDRKIEKVKERAVITLIDDRIVGIDHASFLNKALFREIFDNINKIHYDSFDIEFVYDCDLIFTDFYSSNFGKKLIK